MNPLITIAIPTYNRADRLELMLKNVLGQIAPRDLGTKIELFVSNNASTDATVLVCEKHGVKCVTKAENAGFDGNILSCVNMAAGKYLWMLADDDALVPGGVDVVLNAIEEHKADLLLLRASGIYEWDGASPTDLGRCLRACGFLSSCVFNTSMARRSIERIWGKLGGIGFIHWGVVMDMANYTTPRVIDRTIILGNKNAIGHQVSFSVTILGRLKTCWFFRWTRSFYLVMPGLLAYAAYAVRSLAYRKVVRALLRLKDLRRRGTDK